ncbi:MAG TPA: glycosyltransferase family 2 protein [Candidatus Acidoferrales bacterium]|nr:glycosyltransferase family 2 protein [Candidatus Acidoferrales bacterium]
MDYSIIIPLFNKAELTRNCLAKLQPSLEGAGEGEVIVIDNASTDHTQTVLADFPWIRAVRNDVNVGFAAANNQGARMARGRVLVLLNNDTEPITKWLAPMMRLLEDRSVGAVGAKLLFPKGKIQHCGVLVRWWPYSAMGMQPFHYLYDEQAQSNPQIEKQRDYQIVTGACLATPRELYLELGGLDEGYWNGNEDVDYCLKLRERGLRVVYEPGAALFHYESQSGTQRFRRMQPNMQRLADRWLDKVEFDASRVYVEDGRYQTVHRFSNGGESFAHKISSPIDVLVHGDGSKPNRDAFERDLRRVGTPIASITWCAQNDAVERARSMMELRGDRFVAFVRTDTRVEPGWLDELLARVTAPANCVAATFLEGTRRGTHAPIVASDARCVILRLRMLPQDMELGDFPTLDAATADLLVRALQQRRGTVAAFPHATMGSTSYPELLETSPAALERVMRSRPAFERGLVSIVTLSWNTPEFTLQALESIRQHTAEPYEVIVVDNGSRAETLAALATIDDPHVKIVYNKTNRGFSGGNNDGIAHARGDYVILLNNDVIVTPGWADGLVDAFRRIPGLGISAPRSNNVTGDQQVADAQYGDIAAMQAYAVERRRLYGQQGYITDRAIGFCWCISRTVLDQIGALDERYVLGNFEDDDYCMRVRAAGYLIYVCNDVFIHHFGSRSFAANNVDYRSTMSANWEKFAKKWGFSGPLPETGYYGADAHARGFKRAEHYLPFPGARTSEPEVEALHGARAIFGAAVRSEADWSEVAKFVRRFAQAFKLEDGVALAIGALAVPDATAIAARVERILEKAGISVDACGDIEIADYDDEAEWAARAGDARWIDLGAIEDRSPSALRRALGSHVK